MNVVVEGQELKLYTIGYTAKILKKSVETLRAWEREKVIPRPMYVRKRVRLYHPKEVETMKVVLRKCGKKASKADIKKAMWAALSQTRREILNGSNETQQNQSGSDLHSPPSSDSV